MTSATGSDPQTHDAGAPLRPVTGDDDVDRALSDLDHELLGDGDAQLEALTRAHRRLQTRLTGPSDAPDLPGRARPGPR